MPFARYRCPFKGCLYRSYTVRHRCPVHNVDYVAGLAPRSYRRIGDNIVTEWFTITCGCHKSYEEAPLNWTCPAWECPNPVVKMR
jgi:hypothetical protein